MFFSQGIIFRFHKYSSFYWYFEVIVVAASVYWRLVSARYGSNAPLLFCMRACCYPPPTVAFGHVWKIHQVPHLFFMTLRFLLWTLYFWHSVGSPGFFLPPLAVHLHLATNRLVFLPQWHYAFIKSNCKKLSTTWIFHYSKLKILFSDHRISSEEAWGRSDRFILKLADSLQCLVPSWPVSGWYWHFSFSYFKPISFNRHKCREQTYSSWTTEVATIMLHPLISIFFS
jgi:hypothetical protein